MVGLPWMDNLRLSLDNHFVELEMKHEYCNASIESKQKVELKDLFPSNDSFSIGEREDGERILIEGGAGFGKSTAVAKLCYDYGNKQNYLKQFDIVLSIHL